MTATSGANITVSMIVIWKVGSFGLVCVLFCENSQLISVFFFVLLTELHVCERTPVSIAGRTSESW